LARGRLWVVWAVNPLDFPIWFQPRARKGGFENRGQKGEKGGLTTRAKKAGLVNPQGGRNFPWVFPLSKEGIFAPRPKEELGPPVGTQGFGPPNKVLQFS